MAFTKKTKGGVQVLQGNTGEVLATFRGPKADAQAREKVTELHQKNHPKAINKGALASRRFR